MTIQRTLTALGASALVGALALSATPTSQADDPWQPLEPTDARTDNPLKGFMPFGIELDHDAANFPYTMEWFYLPLDAVVKGDQDYDWTEFETSLGAIAGRGNQAALRFYLDYPGQETGVPDYLLGPDGIDQSRTYDFFDNEGISFSPDYDDPRVQALIKDFVAEFGDIYDGDPRIGYITTGLIGFWGEQHTWPMNGYPDAGAGNPDGEQWMPERDVELSYYEAWDQAFNTTRLLNRYPFAGLEDISVGFHDDSFAVSTLPDVSWHFMAHMEANDLTGRWESEVIGGEIQPPVQLCVFDDPPSCEDPAAEDFDEAVQLTHVTWLMNHLAYTTGYEGQALERALASHASLGYDLSATAVTIDADDENTRVSLRITNRGVAPFYYDWPGTFGLIDDNGSVLATTEVELGLPDLLPGQSTEISTTIPAGDGVVAFQIPNTMEGGAPLKLANATQDADLDGWLSLGEVEGSASGETPSPSPSPSASPAPSASTSPAPRPGLPGSGR